MIHGLLSLARWGERITLFALCLRFASAFAADSIPSTNLHNVFVVTPKFYSGSSPDSAAGFAELAKLGLKTVISVDGAAPDVALAKQYGLEYVHLPVGYDGIPTNRAVELVKAAQTLEGPFYVHCHHGKHRGPTAVALMCEAVSGWSTNLAEQWMKQAGTAADYPGLYRSAREFKTPSAAELASVKELPEVSRTSSLVEAMVAIDEHLKRLKGAQKSSWRSVPGHPDVQPAHEAALLWEQFREMERFNDVEKRPEDYRATIASAVESADQFHALLKQSPIDLARSEEAFKQVSQSCAACHKKYRN